MPLPAGVRLGPYEILASIGAGGMGEVYRAKDTKLKRDVALKVLPAALARDPERMARFQREAEVLASLNHPNIAAIYGVEHSEDGMQALAMEMVEGESPKGPLPFDEAWHIASRIAAALEYAHEKGVVHRDLKPANVKVTADGPSSGSVKLLDFGLAKALSPQAEGRPAGSAENSPTLTIGATEAGMILGTAAYMAPEQAKGKTVDKRADIWAFGVVLYELLTGERPFHGEDVGDVLASVIKDRPDLGKVPARVRPLIARCLEKDPKKRLRDIGDAASLVVNRDSNGAGEGGVAAATMPAHSHSRFGSAGWIAAGALLVSFAALAFVHFREKPPAMETLRYTIAAPENSSVHSFAISPDGRFVVIAATVGGKRQLWLRALDALQPRPMAFTEDAAYPFGSPDSRFIGFFAEGKLKKVAASGGPSQVLCDVPNGRGGSWNRDGVIIFALDASGRSIQRVLAGGGVPADVTKTTGDQRFPMFLPGGHRFLYLLRGSAPETNGIYVSSLDGTENRRILADYSGAVFAPAHNGGGASGNLAHILFVRGNTLMAQPFDAASAQPAGDAFAVADPVSLGNFAYAPVSVSDNYVMLYSPGGVTASANQIAWYDRGGKLLGTVGAPGSVFDPALSPDERSVAYRRDNGTGANDLWLRDLARGTETRFTSDSSTNAAPLWSRDGERIVFASNRKTGTYDLFQKAASGSAQEEILLTSGYNKSPEQWSRDGRFIVYHDLNPKTNRDIWVLPMEGPEQDRKPIPFLQTEFDESRGQLSPDSHWMAYTSDQSGRREVYVRPFPKAEGQWTISVAGGQDPRWRADGKELFYQAADGKIMAVPVKASAGLKPSFEAGAPVALFDAQIVESSFNIAEYDVTADGKRFLIDTTGTAGGASGAAASPPLNVVVNWNSGKK